MNKKIIFDVIKHPKELLIKINYRYPQMLSWISDEKCLRFWYWYRFGKKLNLKKPKTFNEKIQWLKLNDRNPLYTTMVDKYEAKKYVSSIIGDEYIIPTLGVWNKFDDIDFDKLPDQFVLKCTHDSGGLVICKDKSIFNINAARKKINRSLKRNFYWVGREWPYKAVPPRIIAEKYMENGDGTEELYDYKLMCFSGKVKCTFTVTKRYSKEGPHITFYDLNWNRMPFGRHYPVDTIPMEQPQSYPKMTELAEKLAANLPFVRIDFYEINGAPYFGEITFYPGSGLEEFTPDSWDTEIGNWVSIPNYIDKNTLL
jgi:hypothetical protein